MIRNAQHTAKLQKMRQGQGIELRVIYLVSTYGKPTILHALYETLE
jgi:hypothetical protein